LTHTVDYVLFSSFSKIFRTISKDVVDECMLLFRCSVLTVVNKRKAIFWMTDYLKSYNNLCELFAHVADNEKKRNHNTVVELRTIGDNLYYTYIIS